jgi:hypothetical protein
MRVRNKRSAAVTNKREDVAGLKVAVERARVVGVGHARRDLAEQRDQPLRRENRRRNLLGQDRPIDLAGKN